MDKNRTNQKLVFALDIGTRSVVGLVGEQVDSKIRLIASERQEHHTRAMLDGQIHDVPEVAGVLQAVKMRLEEKIGSPLRKVAVAAAGRALLTMRASADTDCSTRGFLTAEDERALELAAIQSAQRMLATSHAVIDPASYYCVGFSVVHYCLDQTLLTSLIGQRGKSAAIEIIATFLPRQVIDSLQAALQSVGLEMDTLTLEPIAAINVLIPATMRHLNLTLVDVGAGTSDVAITSEGSVVGYGMVPCAGDEITEAISQRYLLDFNIAEDVKRQLSGKPKKIPFTDVLGMSHKVGSQEILDGIVPHVADLAQNIAQQIMTLNKTIPQAVLLVGGGALTPLLPEALSQALDIPPARVAIRRPDNIEGITGIPADLCAPDTVTPLGILRLAGGRALNFVNIRLNGQPVSLFNLSSLTVADALLAAAVDVRSLHGRPGLAVSINVNGETKFISGTHGQPGRLEKNGESAQFTDPLTEGDEITIIKGVDGSTPAPAVCDVVTIPAPISLTVDGKEVSIPPVLTVNQQPALPATILQDRDEVICRVPASLGEALETAGLRPDPITYRITVNGSDREWKSKPSYRLNGEDAKTFAPVQTGDIITIIDAQPPTVADLMDFSTEGIQDMTVIFNGNSCTMPLRRYTVTRNGLPASSTEALADGDILTSIVSENSQPMVSDVLLAARFDPNTLPRGKRIEILLNGRPTEYTSVVSHGDKVEVIAVERPPSPFQG